MERILAAQDTGLQMVEEFHVATGSGGPAASRARPPGRFAELQLDQGHLSAGALLRSCASQEIPRDTDPHPQLSRG